MINQNHSITIDLNPVLEGYCRWIFEMPKRCDIKVNQNHDIGKHICSSFQVGRSHDPRPVLINPVTFILPITEHNHYIFKTKPIHVNKFYESQIVNYIDAYFGIWVREKFELGYLMDQDQRAIIEAILTIINVRNNADNYEMVKKRDYRVQKKKEQIRFEMLLNCSISSKNKIISGRV
jgi:hypothetical protein